MADVEKRLSYIPSAATLGDAHDHESDDLKKPLDSEFVDSKYEEDSWFAWLVVLAGCIQAMITLGASRSHGVYQEYYVINEFSNSSTASISWIGSVQNTMLNLCGVFVGILSQIYDARIMCAIGSLCMGLSFILA
ncbi:hypothetical protein GGF48_006281, partial [Coemansia sp. RSA 921]